MNLNRHNYEEFFLMYADNELTAADRKAVELFVQQNPDLKPELDLLVQAVLPAHTINFENKKELLKLENHQQALLLDYLDGELSNAADAENLVSASPAAKKEWDLLQQTKLKDEKIVFEGKENLYRKAPARVAQIKWWRAAAAVLLLGIGGWIFYNNINSGNISPEIITNINPVPEKTNSNSTVNNTPVVENNLTPATVVQPAVRASEKELSHNNQAAVYKHPVSTLPEKINKTPDKKDNSLVIKEYKKPDNNLPKVPLQIINNNQSNQNDMAIVTPSNSEVNNTGKTDAVAIKSVDKTETNIIKPTLFVEPGAEEEKNDDRFFYAKQEDVKRSKVGGFFKKVKRMVERSANIKTGNSIRVANIEFTSL